MQAVQHIFANSCNFLVTRG